MKARHTTSSSGSPLPLPAELHMICLTCGPIGATFQHDQKQRTRNLHIGGNPSKCTMFIRKFIKIHHIPPENHQNSPHSSGNSSKFTIFIWKFIKIHHVHPEIHQNSPYSSGKEKEKSPSLPWDPSPASSLVRSEKLDPTRSLLPSQSSPGRAR